MNSKLKFGIKTVMKKNKTLNRMELSGGSKLAKKLGFSLTESVTQMKKDSKKKKT